MLKTIKKILKYGFFPALGIFLIWWQLKDMNAAERNEFRSALTDAHYLLIIPVLAMSLLSHLSRAVRWKILIEPLGYHPKTHNTFFSVMVGYLANSALPRLGEVLKCTILGKYEKIPASPLVGTILLERTVDLITYALLIALTIVIQADVIGPKVMEIIDQVTAGSAIPLWLKVLVFVLMVTALVLFFRWLFKKYPHNRVVSKMRHISRDVAAGFATIKHIKNRGWFLAHTLFIWTMYLLEIYVGFRAVEATSHLGLAAACSLLTIGTLAMIVTPNGIGAFPIAIAGVLTLYDVTSGAGKSFGWIIWGVTTGIIIVFGIISLVLIPIVNKQKIKKTETGTSSSA
jgi:glycosyltransferase 2 family protein